MQPDTTQQWSKLDKISLPEKMMNCECTVLRCLLEGLRAKRGKIPVVGHSSTSACRDRGNVVDYERDSSIVDEYYRLLRRSPDICPK
jgi:hypothetical protein